MPALDRHRHGEDRRHLLVNVIPEDAHRIGHVHRAQVAQHQPDRLRQLDVPALAQAGRDHLAVEDALARRRRRLPVLAVRAAAGAGQLAQQLLLLALGAVGDAVRLGVGQPGGPQDRLEPVEGDEDDAHQAVVAVLDQGAARQLDVVVADVPAVLVERIRLREALVADDVARLEDAHGEHCRNCTNDE